jgi:hypothetical protein
MTKPTGDKAITWLTLAPLLHYAGSNNSGDRMLALQLERRNTGCAQDRGVGLKAGERGCTISGRGVGRLFWMMRRLVYHCDCPVSFAKCPCPESRASNHDAYHSTKPPGMPMSRAAAWQLPLTSCYVWEKDDKPSTLIEIQLVQEAATIGQT